MAGVMSENMAHVQRIIYHNAARYPEESWNQPNAVFGHEAEWAEFCRYCEYDKEREGGVSG